MTIQINAATRLIKAATADVSRHISYLKNKFGIEVSTKPAFNYADASESLVTLVVEEPKTFEDVVKAVNKKVSKSGRPGAIIPESKGADYAEYSIILKETDVKSDNSSCGLTVLRNLQGINKTKKGAVLIEMTFVKE
jgi:hypothetical protein